MRAHAWGLLAALLVAAACGGGGYVELGYGWGGDYDPYGYWDFGWYPYASAAGDFDGDGALELVVVDGKDGKVHLADGTERHKPEPVPTAPFIARPSVRWMYAGRFDADDRLDLVLIGAAGTVIQVYLGDGAGGFTRARDTLCDACGAGVRSVAVGRIDADAFSDLVILDEIGDLNVLLADGLGGFRSPIVALELGPSKAEAVLVCADLDGVSGAEVAAIDAREGQVEVFAWSTAGVFERRSVFRTSIPGVLFDAVACVGESGTPADLAILYGDSAGQRVARKLYLHGDRAGTLSSPHVDGGGAERVDAVDLTGNGLSDLVLVDPVAGVVRVYEATPRRGPRP